MMTQLESVQELEELLVGSGVKLTPAVDPVDLSDLQTADGKFKVQPTRVGDRPENLVTLYRTDNGEAVPTSVNEAIKRLRKRYPANDMMRLTYPELVGQRAFTLGVLNKETGAYVAPFPHKVGNIFCPLNRQSLEFEYTRGLGIQSTCPRRHIPNVIEMEIHVQHRHLGVWALMERDRERREKQEDRDRMEQLVAIALGQRGLDTSRAPEVADAIIEQQAEEAGTEEPAGASEPETPATSTPKFTVPCATCGETFGGSKLRIAKDNLERHQKRTNHA